MKIGQIVTEGQAGRRDSFHVPSVLVTCDCVVEGGQSVRFVDDTYSLVRPVKHGEDRHGIVDPFIGDSHGDAEPGQLFWVLLVPSLVTQLVHHFDLNIVDVPKVVDDGGDDDGTCAGCW